MNQDKAKKFGYQIYNQGQEQGLNVSEFTQAALQAIMVLAFMQSESAQKAIASALETSAKCLKGE